MSCHQAITPQAQSSAPEKPYEKVTLEGLHILTFRTSASQEHSKGELL